jgi:hypothetical protein
MPLVPYVPFTSGSPFTSEIANEIVKPVFDDQTQYFGHLNKIRDVDLSDDPAGIKSRVAANELNLKVTAGTGLNALFTSGRAIYGKDVYQIAGSSIALTASSTNYVYVDVDGVVKTTTGTPPIVRALLAIVTTNTTGVVTVVDLREGYKVEVIKPLATSVRNFGGRGDGGAFVAAGGEVLADGEYYFTDFTVAAGKTISIDKLARIYCTGAVNIAGTVEVFPGAAGAAGTIQVGALVAGAAGQGFGAGIGEAPTATYNHLISPVGSGSANGSFISEPPGRAFVVGGGYGGGCCWIEAAGKITITGAIRANGTNGQAGYIGSDTAILKTVIGATSGGSGGLILLKSLDTIRISGVLEVKGGAGGLGVATSGGLAAESGCGGGGGRIVVFSPDVNTTNSTLRLDGGTVTNVNTSGANITAINSSGASYGGLGGSALGTLGLAGETGVITIKNYTPLG